MTASVRLRRPLPLTPALVASVQDRFTLAETGALVVLAMAWWPKGELPRSIWAARKALRTDHYTAKRALALFRPLFAPDGDLGVLRAAHIAKAGRRARAARKSTAARMAKRVEGGGMSDLGS